MHICYKIMLTKLWKLLICEQQFCSYEAYVLRNVPLATSLSVEEAKVHFKLTQNVQNCNNVRTQQQQQQQQLKYTNT